MIGLVCMCTKEHFDVAIKASIECEKVSGKTSYEHVISYFSYHLAYPSRLTW